MTKQEEIREGIDRIICEAEDPDIPYEEQSAPMLDWTWSVSQRILKYLHSQGVVILASDVPIERCSFVEPLIRKGGE